MFDDVRHNSLAVNLVQNKERKINRKINPVKIPHFQILEIVRKGVPDKRFDLIHKHRFDVDSPTFGLVNNFAKPAPVVGQRQAPKDKEQEPDADNDIENLKFHFTPIFS